MTEMTTVRETTDEVRRLAGHGRLAEYAGTVTGDARRRLWKAVYEIVQPVVFQQVTRKLELRRGHLRCAASVHHLDDSCLDGYHEDMQAVVEHVLRNARMPIRNLEGWTGTRLTVATVDGYRRRRSALGALQRPRIPKWLATRLGGERLLLDLAVEILEFVGNDVSAGLGVWPTERWAERRATSNGDYEMAHRAVLRDIQTVLTAMRTRPRWYESYVERPLGRKRLPVVPLSAFAVGAVEEVPMAVVGHADHEESALVEKAALAFDHIRARVAHGEEPAAVIPEVVASVFEPGLGGGELDQLPGTPSSEAEPITARLADRGVRERITAAVMAVLSGR